ncbi:hypothetical protein RA8CHR_04895 [Variovorax sp. RA8]|nr:hypothetical protein RA8CHR_04895 [Variovorax sp. RA8]
MQWNLRVLYEIRLHRSEELEGDPRPVVAQSLWLPDTQANRKMLQQAAEEGNRHFGDATHWIEERQA